MAAKQVIQDARQICLPELEVRVAGYTAIGQKYDEFKQLVPSGPFSFEDVQVEEVLGDIKPDVIGLVRGRKLLIEIAVTHFIDDIKLRRIRELDLACVEFDLSELGRTTTLADLRRVLLEEPNLGRWRHHPKSAPTRAVLQARVQGLIDADKERHARRQARAAERRRLEEIQAQRAVERKNQQRLAYQQLSGAEKLRYSLRLMGLPESQPPAFLNIPVWKEGAFGVHRSVWQAAMFGAYLHKRHPDLEPTFIDPEAPRDWLFQQLGLTRPPCENSLKAVTNYLFKLTDLGITTRHFRVFKGRLYTTNDLLAMVSSR